MPEAQDPTATDIGALSSEERTDLQDAIDQDKELRWLERDTSVAEKSLLDAPEGLRAEDLRKLHRAHRDAQQRLAAAHSALLAFLVPQFKRRREARRMGDEVVVFTREEFRLLNIEERSRMETPGRDGARIAAELRQRCREMLEARGWKPRVPSVTKGGRAPTLAKTAWQVRKRLSTILAQGAAGFAADDGTAAPSA